ncbi:MAG TPA: 6-phosphogluconolactonase [Candidatus Dormibacteraeota bacterium]
MSRDAAGLPGTVELASDPAELAARAAGWVLGYAATVIAEGRRFHIALAGGHTPAALYDVLASAPARKTTDWLRWEFWWGDERACPPDDAGSNYRLAHDRLLRHLPLDRLHIHRMRGESPDLAAAAGDYAAELASHLAAGPGSAPRLDLVLLGLGTNGHTASLFPGQKVLDVTDRWVAPARADYAPFERLTLTLPTLNAAAGIAFIVAGADKGPALREVAAGTAVAARVRPARGELRWFLDTAAATSMGGAPGG